MESPAGIGAKGRAALDATRPLLIALLALAVAAVPAAVGAAWLTRQAFDCVGDCPYGLYVATTAVAWGGLALALVLLSLVARRRVDRRALAVDAILGVAALAVLGAWIFSVYDWSIGKWGHVELDPVSPTTKLWPLLVVLAVAVLPLSRGRRQAIGHAVPVAVILLLAVDVALGLWGALRDGSVSGSGLVVGLLYGLELVILGFWTAWSSGRWPLRLSTGSSPGPGR